LILHARDACLPVTNFNQNTVVCGIYILWEVAN